MVNFEVRMILVDQGIFDDIMFLDLLTTLGISEEDLNPLSGKGPLRIQSLQDQTLGLLQAYGYLRGGTFNSDSEDPFFSASLQVGL